MEIREGLGGRFGLGNPGGRGGSKNLAIRRMGGGGGLWIFSGITQFHIPR